jgi:hypothetical protein
LHNLACANAQANLRKRSIKSAQTLNNPRASATATDPKQMDFAHLANGFPLARDERHRETPIPTEQSLDAEH